MTSIAGSTPAQGEMAHVHVPVTSFVSPTKRGSFRLEETNTSSGPQATRGYSPSVSVPACSRFGSLACLLLILAIGIGAAALQMVTHLARPPVWVDSTPKSPEGYYYGGAVYQGSGIWITNKPVLPFARSDFTAVSVSNKILLLGGANAAQAVLNDTLEFDPIFERYNTSRAPIPIARYRHASAAGPSTGSKVFLMGGISVYNGDQLPYLHIYDASADTWTRGPDMSVARSDLAADVINGRVYAFGGYGIGFDMSVTGTLVECYDPATNAWTVKTPMPTARGDLEAVAFGNRIFVLGGWNDQAATNPHGFTTATEAYSPATDSWATHAHMIVPKGDLAAAVYRGRIFGVGGEIWSGKTGPCDWDPTLTCDIDQVPTHDTVALSPDTLPASITENTGVNTAGSVAGSNGKPGVWIPHAPSPGARFRFAGVANEASQALWVFGGTKDNGELVDLVSAFYDTDHPPVFVHYKS